MDIRTPVASDFESLSALVNWAIAETHIHFGSAPTDAATMLAGYQSVCGEYPWFVAADEQQVLGFASSGVYKPREAYRWTCDVSVYVDRLHHGKGLGKALYSRLLQELRDQGFRSAVASIALPNEASIALHEKLGFQLCGTIREAGYKFECWHDVGIWQLMLTDAH